MASSMLTAEVSAAASAEADVDNALKAALYSCINDPDFAIICDFLQKFSKDLGLDLPNFKLLLQWLTKTDEVSPQLRDMQIKLLRKTRKTVHEKSWESALSKFCFTYSAQDGWEIERFGYKNSSVKVKLRILRELLECQFERNTKFRAKILTLSADSLRSKPIGRDRQGHAYWVTQDNDCNIRIYQEHLDEEIWQVVATNRDEFVNLLMRLRGSEVVLPCKEIGIVDEDTASSSSQIGSDLVQKVSSAEEKEGLHEGELKVPKLSIKLIHGKSSTETSNAKDLGKGEEEIAEEEDAKLLKKNSISSATIDSVEEEFEEIEEDYSSGSSSEAESVVCEKTNVNKEKTQQINQKNIKSKDESKIVKPLLISQNKIVNNQASNNGGKKRGFKEDNETTLGNRTEVVSAIKKFRPSLLESKRSKHAMKYYDDTKESGEEDNNESLEEDEDVEEEIDEEDIDSVAAEEDENEEKLFEDYDDEDEEEQVGKEICDPIVHVIGEGSGKDCDVKNYMYCKDYELVVGEEICDSIIQVTENGPREDCGVENYFYCIDYDFDIEIRPILSDTIVEDVYYLQGEGSGRDCLIGNNEKHDEDTINVEKKSISNIRKTADEEKFLPQSKKKEYKSNLCSEHTDVHKIDTSNKHILNDTSLSETQNLSEDLDRNIQTHDQNCKKTFKSANEHGQQKHLKEEMGQINGESNTNITFQIETVDKNHSNSNKTLEKYNLYDVKKEIDVKSLEITLKQDVRDSNSNLNKSNKDLPTDVELTQQTLASKMNALESLKKELKESKQKLLEKKFSQTNEVNEQTLSCPGTSNRKRRLTDQVVATTARQPNSESEVEHNPESTDDCPNGNEAQIDESEQNIGGKRLKIRPKQTNTELRKKIEAQKVAAIDETTSSSSSSEEEIKKRKKLLMAKQTTMPLVSTTEKKLQSSDSRKCVTKNVENVPEIGNKSPAPVLTQELLRLKQTAQNKTTKVKPTLAEIIEKKLKKKTQDKLQYNTNQTDIVINREGPSTAKKIFHSTKDIIPKPLKKNVLMQIRKVESDDDMVPRKRTNSEELNSEILNDAKTFNKTTTMKCSMHTVLTKTSIKKDRATPEKQRKRRSSEETVQNDSPEEPEAKKEVFVDKENLSLKPDKVTITNEEETKEESKDCKLQKESSELVTNRRSSRRGGEVSTYIDIIQSKRNRCPAKSLIKKNETINERSNSLEGNARSTNAKNNVSKKINGDKSTVAVDKSSLIQEHNIEESNMKKKIDLSKSISNATTKTPIKAARKQREVDTTNIIDIDNETPVRQSRRIAQQKIREEAERRKLEEIALRTMKQELKKKKMAEKQSDPTIVPPTEPSSESEESDVEIKRKVQKKKCPGKNGNWSSGSEEQEEPEEEDEEPHHYDTDPGSPLFKSDHEFSPESDIEDESQAVPMKRARTVRKENADGDAAGPDEEEACQKCNKSDHPEWILLCDNCDKGYHCSCLSPVLFYIPEGDWFCPPCQQEQLIKALENQLKEFDDLVENKRKIEEHEKRVAEEEQARKEREEETNKNKAKIEKRINAKKNSNNSSAEDQSQEEDEGDEEDATNSDDSINSNSKNQSSRKKHKHRSRTLKNSDKRSHRDRRPNATRSRRNRRHKIGTDSNSESQNSSQSNSTSRSHSSCSSTYSESDNEPIYKLRKRRQINVSYRLNEYDDLINSALKKEMDGAAGAGNLGRGKDISTIIEADKEEKARQKQIEDRSEAFTNETQDKTDETKQDSSKLKPNENKNKDENNDIIKQEEIDSDTEPIIRKLSTKPLQKKKSRKLTTLDISSEDDDESDEDFKGSSFDDDEEEDDTSISASNSDSSLEIYKRHGKFKKKRRKAARRAFRERRKDRRFLVDESDDEDVQRPKSKKKRKDYSDYTESDVDDDEISELSENIDSADLCDDTTTDESDAAWKPNKKKKAKKSISSFAQKSTKTKSSHTKKHKKVEYSDDDVSDSEEDEDDDGDDNIGSGKGMGKQPRSQPLKSNFGSTKMKGKGKEKTTAKTKKKNSEDESSESNSEDSTRRTRGRRYAYIEDFDDDSSDGGIKPGVQRPDTPPEEREKFIKRQEEIKRMLAEKNAEGAKLAATPRLTPIKTDTERDKRSPAKVGGDSLSTVPLSVIRQAKVLDIDYLQRRGENLEDLGTEVGEVDDDFDDADLPDDLPEDMDEDAIARMVEEEEEFGVAATKEHPAPVEVLRTAPAAKPAKTKEVEKPILLANTSSQFQLNTLQVTPVTLAISTSNLQEPVRKRLPMPTMHPPLLRHQFLMHDTMPNTQHHLMQRHGGPHSSHLLQNALSAPLTQPLNRNYPTTTSSETHHSLINRLTHSIPLQPTVSHDISTNRPPHSSLSPITTKSSPMSNQPTVEKTPNAQNTTENKPRGRRKKITPLRDTLQKQQTAAAVTAATASSSALASSLVKNDDSTKTPLLSAVNKSGPGPKLSVQGSVMSNMPPASHSATSRPGIPIPPIRGPYIRTDGPRFYESLGNRISQPGVHRHRGPPQMPPSLLSPHPANRSSYGPPPPLKGSNSGPPVALSSNTSGSVRNSMQHAPPPYLGMPPNARHASHLNIYSRPPIYGNPNFGPRVNLRPTNIHPSDYSASSRAYPPYGFYPPPPPLTTPGHRAGPSSAPRPSTQMTPAQSVVIRPPVSVIVSTTSSKSATSEISGPSSNSVVVAQELTLKIPPEKSPSPTIIKAETEKKTAVALPVMESRKKLTTLQTYNTSPAKKSPILLASESSDSRSPPNIPAGINVDSSTHSISENTSTAEQTNRQEGQASEFSGLVSYFSSQHDDYNT